VSQNELPEKNIHMHLFPDSRKISTSSRRRSTAVEELVALELGSSPEVQVGQRSSANKHSG
jgi:hypothetical protein